MTFFRYEVIKLKKKKLVKFILIPFVVILIIIISLFSIRFISMNFHSKEKLLAISVYNLIESFDYDKVSEVYEEFLYENDYSKIIEKYKDVVFESENETIELTLRAKYFLSLIITGEKEQFEKVFKDYIVMGNSESYDIFSALWDNVINDDQIKYEDIEEMNSIIEKICNYSDEVKFWSKNFQYYICSYFNQHEKKQQINIEIDELLNTTNMGDDYLTYEDQRLLYVSSLLIFDKYEQFKKMFLEEYSKRSFSGMDIVVMHTSGRLTENQTSILIESLGELYLYVEENGNDKFLLEKIANVKGIVDGSISEDAE